MAEIISIETLLRQNSGKKGVVSFTRAEIGILISVYSEKVARGIWRDYGLSMETDYAVFSIFRSSHETPLYTVTKQVDRKRRNLASFSVRDGRTVLKKGQSLTEVIQVLRDKDD